MANVVKKDDIAYGLSKLSRQFESVLPSDITKEKFMRVCLTSIQNNPSLATADRSSLWNACIKCATDGLIPDGREAAFVVMGKSAQYMPMVSGIIKKMRISGNVSKISARVVYENDHFEYWLDEKGDHILHRPDLSGSKGNPTNAYAIVITKDGTCEIEIMSYNEIETVRSKSRAKNNGPWVDFWGEMAKKTVIRRLAKRLPFNTSTDKVIESDNETYDLSMQKPNEKPKLEDIVEANGDDEL